MAADLTQADVTDLRERLAQGGISAVELTTACLNRIEKTEPQLQAWAWLDGSDALEQARVLDERRKSGAVLGALHGLPVGIKDVIDTGRMPTENGTAIDKGRVPSEDSGLVARLRAAGAVIMGKTVTTELAFMEPSKSRNPHDVSRTPGGSSAGSAVAVAAGMVPLAVGTQTGGSVIRPASFCGVVGYKPSFGMIGRSGVLQQSPFLDTIGVFARSVPGAALLAEAMAGHDPADPATTQMPAPRLYQEALSALPGTPRLALVDLPAPPATDPRMRAALDELAGFLGDMVERIELPAIFSQAQQMRTQINQVEMAKYFAGYERRGRHLMSLKLTEAIDAGKAILAGDYMAALDWREDLNAGLDRIFDRCDAILCAASPGPAPEGLGSTGDSAFNGIWTLCGTPVVTLPLFLTRDGLPMGLQIVGRLGDDARLLRIAAWLMQHVGPAGEPTRKEEMTNAEC
ncbi:amidase [Paracoccus onubensis]|uniref:amidase n=1 Tax=Paracoccus onubensis TaxID=1675788 RepID=UPI00273211A4|nr:amidase [Paracoccus onubensis]MDP0929569.1 amidase [Paracoccus onubensis]